MGECGIHREPRRTGLSIHEWIMIVMATWAQQGLNSLQMLMARLSGIRLKRKKLPTVLDGF